MPLYKTINFNSKTQILVWKITESLQQLRKEVQLSGISQIRVDGMKSEMHQQGFLSIRKLLQEANYTDFDLFYDPTGKPHLNDGKYISITHSHEFSAIIISDECVGIDIEWCREKIKSIATKFADTEMALFDLSNNLDCIRKLTVIWGIKESIFKIRNEKGISFRKHIIAAPFEMEQKQGVAKLFFEEQIKIFDIYFEEIERFVLVYALEKQVSYLQ